MSSKTVESTSVNRLFFWHLIAFNWRWNHSTVPYWVICYPPFSVLESSFRRLKRSNWPPVRGDPRSGRSNPRTMSTVLISWSLIVNASRHRIKRMLNNNACPQRLALQLYQCGYVQIILMIQRFFSSDAEMTRHFWLLAGLAGAIPTAIFPHGRPDIVPRACPSV